MRRLLALLLVALPAVAIPPGVVGTAPGKSLKFAVSDNFNRDDGALGANWTTVTGCVTCDVRSNGYNVSVYNGVGANFWNGGVFSDNHYSEAKLTHGQFGSSGVIVRASPTAKTMYLFLSTGLNGYRLYKYVAGVEQWWTSNFLYTPPNNATVRLEAVGSTISVFVMSAHGGTKTLLYTVNDATAILTGRPGIYHSGRNNGQGGTGDDWYGGDL